jgi:dolichol-phosphate mannosyltransferase
MAKRVVVIPTYNERENIRRLLPLILKQPLGKQLQILVVDDSSPDGTGNLVAEMAKGNPCLHLLSRPRKSGLGRAYVAGFLWALNVGADEIAQMDADFSHNPCYLPTLFSTLAEADVAVGSRYIPGGGVRNWPRQRQWLSTTANFLTRRFTGLPLHDCTGGFRAYRRRVLEAIKLQTITTSGYAFQIEVAWRISQRGFRFKEIPIIFTDREEGQSKLSRKIIWEACWLITKLGTARLHKFVFSSPASSHAAKAPPQNSA